MTPVIASKLTCLCVVTTVLVLVSTLNRSRYEVLILEFYLSSSLLEFVPVTHRRSMTQFFISFLRIAPYTPSKACNANVSTAACVCDCEAVRRRPVRISHTKEFLHANFTSNIGYNLHISVEIITTLVCARFFTIFAYFQTL